MRFGLSAVAALVFSAAAAAAQVRDATVYDPGNGVSRPVLAKSTEAIYTPEAKAGQIVGDIKFDVTVLADGSVGDVKVVQSCLGHIGTRREPNGAAFPCRAANEYERVDGFDRVKGTDASLGLDQQAQKAVRQWVFKPGMKDGKPVAVRLVIGMDLHP